MKLPELVDRMCHALPQRGVIGISGAQGAGKTTLCAALAAAYEQAGHALVTLSLDDFYLPRAARAKLAAQVHPLCAVRGVPGTHDVGLLAFVLEHLAAGQEVALPRFSKAVDDVLPEKDWPVFTGRADIVLLEGWCVGAHADDLPPTPCNALERAEDPHGIWKAWSRDAAKAYEPLWEMLDALALIRPPGFEDVINARWSQEQELQASTGRSQFHSRAEVERFCQHYESWTRGLWEHLPARADMVIARDADFNFEPHFRGG